MSRTGVLILAALTGGCAVNRAAVREAAPLPAPATVSVDPASADSGACDGCAPRTLDLVLLVRSTARVADLKSRGGECAEYGSVLETSMQAGRVSVRPYMWRVDGRLVSGEAQPDGSIIVARHIDVLNVGIRTIEDVIWTLEHEAAHVAFRISNGTDALSDRANELVRACRS
jgi:hypothetical protein